MKEHAIPPLARELEWLGCELEFYGYKHAMEGFPEAGPTWDLFLEKQRGVLMTAGKIERELKSVVRYNSKELVGIGYSVEDDLNSVTTLLATVEDIKQAAVLGVHDLPFKVRAFTSMVDTYLGAVRSASK